MSAPSDQELIDALRARAGGTLPRMALDPAAVRAAGRRRLAAIRVAGGTGLAVAVTAVVLALTQPGPLFTHHGSSPAGEVAGRALAPLELRSVTSSTDGPCTAPPPVTAAAGAACDFTGGTTYQLGAPLGTATPTSVETTDRPDSSLITVTFDEPGRATIASVTSDAIGTQLAFLVHGRVITASRVMEPITTNQAEFAGATSAQAKQIADAIRTTAASTSG